MGDTLLEARRDGIAQAQEASYKVISFKGSDLPSSYTGFVIGKWLRSLRHGNEYFKLIESDAFYKTYEKFIKSLLQRPGSMVRVAVLSDDPDVALGWSLVEGTTLHYVFVQREQRNKGVARSLMPKYPMTITHLTKSGASIWHNKFPHAVFNPFQ